MKVGPSLRLLKAEKELEFQWDLELSGNWVRGEKQACVSWVEATHLSVVSYARTWALPGPALPGWRRLGTHGAKCLRR